LTFDFLNKFTFNHYSPGSKLVPDLNIVPQGWIGAGTQTFFTQIKHGFGGVKYNPSVQTPGVKICFHK
jgi:hypothetical protein